jgi:hypothetical protein
MIASLDPYLLTGVFSNKSTIPGKLALVDTSI